MGLLPPVFDPPGLPLQILGGPSTLAPVAIIGAPPPVSTAFTPTLAGDFKVWDLTEPVTYRSRRATGNLDDTLLSFAKRRPLSTKELAESGGAYTSLDQMWIIPQALFRSGFVPKPADVVIDGDEAEWTVLETGLSKNRQTWRLTCRNPIIAYDLQDFINVEQADLSYDAGGAPVKTFPDAGGGKLISGKLPCRIQLLSGEIEEERLIRGFKGTYQIPIMKPLALTADFHEYRIKIVHSAGEPTLAGVYLDIVDYKKPESISELPVIGAERRP